MIKFIPGVHPSYKEQFDKLTRAYIANEVLPLNACACFVGNLLNGLGSWVHARSYNGLGVLDNDSHFKPIADMCIKEQSNGLYTAQEIINLEKVFLQSWRPLQNEDSMFDAFCVTLDLLKQIHLSKGEIIDEVPEFKRRVMV
jgi:hypothetical protein